MIKPFSVKTLSPQQWETINACDDFQCGLTGWFAKYVLDVPEAYKSRFDNACKIHDLIGERGGYLKDYILWHFNFVWRTLFMACRRIIYKEPIVNRVINTIISVTLAVLGIIVVTITSPFIFKWGQYKTFTTIINKRCKS